MTQSSPGNPTTRPVDISQSQVQATPSNMLGQLVASDSLPHIDPVNPTLRKQIIEGRDVNLALLLRPTGETGEYRRLEATNETDPTHVREAFRHRPLTLGEFIKAFGIYKAVFCEAYPFAAMIWTSTKDS